MQATGPLRRVVLAAALGLVATVLAGCSTPPVEGEDLAAYVEGKIDEVVAGSGDAATDSSAGTVECPDDLEPEVGATAVCYFTVEDDRYRIDLEVTGVEGDEVAFDIALGERLD